MRTSTSLVVCASALALALARPVHASPAQPISPIAQIVPADHTPIVTSTDADRYGQRERQPDSQRAHDFAGGSSTVVVVSGGGLLLIILVILLIVR